MNNQTFSKLIIFLNSLLILVVYISSAYSQVYLSCVPDDGDTVGHFAKGTTVYYKFVGITGTQKTQIGKAFSTWQNANMTQNCSGVKFQEGTAPAGKVLITISNHPLNNAAARATSYPSQIPSITSSAEIEFDLNYKIETFENSGINTNYYDLSKDGYDTILKKTRCTKLVI